MSERIKIEIDDTELDALALRLEAVLQKSQMALGSTSVATGASRARHELGAVAWALRTLSDEQLRAMGITGREFYNRLPSINRDLRILLGLLGPQAREAMRAYFQIKRIERGVLVGGTAEYLALMATTVIILKQLQIQVEKNRQYIEFVRDQFRTYFDDPERLDLFAMENRLTGVEKWIENVTGLIEMLAGDASAQIEPYGEVLP